MQIKSSIPDVYTYKIRWTTSHSRIGYGLDLFSLEEGSATVYNTNGTSYDISVCNRMNFISLQKHLNKEQRHFNRDY